MKVIRERLAEGARRARGVAVIIDVFRAFTCAPFFFHFGARSVRLEPDTASAIALQKAHPDWILAGEENEVPLEGADLSNSPEAILRKGDAFFRGRTVIHRTTAGVQGAAAAMEVAEEVLLGGFLTTRATADYLLKRRPETVTLVSMGSRGTEPAPEDEACADYLEHLLTGRPHDPVAALQGILFQPTARKFLHPERPYLPPEDPVLCLQRDLFDMVLGVERREGALVVVRKGAPDRTS